MSNDANNSILSNLKNKITYNIQQAVYDPKANEVIEKQQQTEEEKKKKLEEEKRLENEKKDISSNDNPNTFSSSRFLKKIGSNTLSILLKIMIPFLALMLAMIVANELIVYSVPIRIIFFIFILFICTFLPFYIPIIGFFYILKGGYSYYINNISGGPKQNIMPTIFALLPITTYKPQSSFGAFFLYPFTYPKSENDKYKLPKIMDNYWNSLVNSFKDYDKVKNLPIFVDDIQKTKKSVLGLHNIDIVNKINDTVINDTNINDSIIKKND